MDLHKYSSLDVEKVNKCQIIANMMCRDEPFAVYGLLSIIDYIDYALVVDTGSEDGTFEELVELSKMFPDKIDLRQIKLSNGHNWSITNRQVIVDGIPSDVRKSLGNIRRYMHKISNSEWVWLIDGDEVYYQTLADNCRQLMCGEIGNKICIYLPFIDYVQKFGHVGQYHNMGRLFKQNQTTISDDYPCEMHCDLRGKMLQSHNPTVLNVSAQLFTNKVQHFESILKPNRKNHSVKDVIEISQMPEVFIKYNNQFPRIEKYVCITDLTD